MPDPTHCRLHTHTDGCDDEHPCPWRDDVPLAPPNLIEMWEGAVGKSEMLLAIRPDGTVEAPSIEAASEAGRVFVESMRARLAPLGEPVAVVDLMEQLAVERERADRLQAQVDAVRAVADLMRRIDAEYVAGVTGGMFHPPTNAVTALNVAARLDAALAAPVQPPAEGGE